MTLKLNFEKIEFQNRGISLISLKNETKCRIFYAKGAETNFLCKTNMVVLVLGTKYVSNSLSLSLT